MNKEYERHIYGPLCRFIKDPVSGKVHMFVVNKKHLRVIETAYKKKGIKDYKDPHIIMSCKDAITFLRPRTRDSYRLEKQGSLTVCIEPELLCKFFGLDPKEVYFHAYSRKE